MTESFASGTPYILWAVGIAALGVVVVASLLMNRRKRASRLTTDEGTRRVYQAEQDDPANRS